MTLARRACAGFVLVWVAGCCFAGQDAPSDEVSALGASVPLPEGARRLCDAEHAHGAQLDGAPWTPLLARLDAGTGGPLRTTTYLLPAPSLGDPMNLATAFYLARLPERPATLHGLSYASMVSSFRPAGAGAIELHGGASAGHPLACGAAVAPGEVLIVMMHAAP